MSEIITLRTACDCTRDVEVSGIRDRVCIRLDRPMTFRALIDYSPVYSPTQERMFEFDPREGGRYRVFREVL